MPKHHVRFAPRTTITFIATEIEPLRDTPRQSVNGNGGVEPRSIEMDPDGSTRNAWKLSVHAEMQQLRREARSAYLESLQPSTRVRTPDTTAVGRASSSAPSTTAPRRKTSTDKPPIRRRHANIDLDAVRAALQVASSPRQDDNIDSSKTSTSATNTTSGLANRSANRAARRAELDRLDADLERRRQAVMSTLTKTGEPQAAPRRD